MLRLPPPDSVSSDEAAFLAAVRADPKDLAPRLVFADWLDDRSDPRGELIRIEEEMRTLPAFADRFWELKPRRNELLKTADVEWLAAFGYVGVVRPLFGHGIPDDWKSRWRLIREFVERWHGIPMGDVGSHPAQVQAAEARLGLTLPPAVREWVAFAHDLDMHATKDRVLYDIYSVEPLRDGYAFSIARDIHESELGWAVRSTDLGRPDPPVYYFALSYGGDFADPRPPLDLGSVTEYVLTNVWSNRNGAGGFGVEVDDPAPLVRELEATFPVKSRFGDMAIYEMDNILVQLYREGKGLEVEVARPLPLEAVPAFLQKYAQGAGRFHGMFADARRRTG